MVLVLWDQAVTVSVSVVCYSVSKFPPWRTSSDRLDLRSSSVCSNNIRRRTLVVHLIWLTVWRSWVTRVHVVLGVLSELLDATGLSLVLTWDLGSWLVTNWWKLDLTTTSLWVAGTWWWWLLIWVCAVALWCNAGWLLNLCLGSTLAVLLSLALGVLLLLASLPLLANLLELCCKSC